VFIHRSNRQSGIKGKKKYIDQLHAINKHLSNELRAGKTEPLRQSSVCQKHQLFASNHQHRQPSSDEVLGFSSG